MEHRGARSRGGSAKMPPRTDAGPPAPHRPMLNPTKKEPLDRVSTTREKRQRLEGEGGFKAWARTGGAAGAGGRGRPPPWPASPAPASRRGRLVFASETARRGGRKRGGGGLDRERRGETGTGGREEADEWVGGSS